MLKKNEKHITYIVFFIIFAVGLSVSKDYGLTIDDEYYRINGIYFYQYIKNILLGANIDLIKNEISYTPALFEIVLAFISDILNITKVNEIYLISHKLNFLIFFISLVALYHLLNTLYQSKIIGILGVIFLFTTPRFFAESFYNSRDIFFLSLFIFNIWSINNFLQKKNFLSLTLLALTSSILINSKIFGILPILIFSFFYLIEASSKKEINRKIKDLTILYALLLLFIYIFWPFLWENPLINFLDANLHHLGEQNKLSVITYYFGEYITSTNAPWHYRIVWIFITIPSYLAILFFLGFIINCKKYLSKLLYLNNKKNKLTNNQKELFRIIIFSIFVSTIFLTMEFNESKLNGWRHLYFLYSIIIIFVLDGIKFLFNKNNKKIVRYIISTACILNIFYLISWSFINHPNQYVFFNFMTKSFSSKKFDLDYWGVSNLQAIKHILKESSKNKITVGTASFSSLHESTLKLTKKDKDRLEIVFNLENADFIIDNNMKRLRNNFKIDKKKYKKILEIKVYDVPINSIYKKTG